MEGPEFRSLARHLVDDPALTYRQRVQQLAALAENALNPPPVSDVCAHALDKRVICDMYEGNAPYRPRYLLPDYAVALQNVTVFLELGQARGLEKALAFLLILDTQVPSI